MEKHTFKDFQDSVAKLPTRHKSILDILTKLQDSNSRINRAVIKSATSCGCIKIITDKQNFHEEMTFDNIEEQFSDHVEGTLCKNCKSAVVTEMGNHMFYITKLANTFDLSLDDVLLKEVDTLSILGKYSLK